MTRQAVGQGDKSLAEYVRKHHPEIVDASRKAALRRQRKSAAEMRSRKGDTVASVLKRQISELQAKLDGYIHKNGSPPKARRGR
jgi:chorismate mutase